MTERTVLDTGPGALSEYYDWMKGAAAGDVLVYWQGDLQFDRQVVVPDEALRASERARVQSLNFIADRICADAKAGLLYLTQKRVGLGIFEYRATRRRDELIQPKPIKKVAPYDNLILA
ncbi:hypothetical protein [Bradyrhizobium sp. SZCCHNS3053]|uniref:hypothetical protein n=1 Tax=Bradyrhizobium sp. SZCCHNS3053 TaxID=3057322 RepID=UPI002916DB37|nr:hypothetical protein [Bradyrhizobium sp. SZCCHNS3053]